MFNGTHYDMWYTTDYTQLAIGFASSIDGVSWTKYPSPVLTGGTAGSWDAGGVERPSVVWNGTMYLMYYGGSNGTLATDIGVAFSKDMIHWQKYSGNPVLTRSPGLWDAFYVRWPSVAYDGSSYKMWYVGRTTLQALNDSIGLATSIDGFHWTKYGGNPVIKADSADFAGVVARNPSVILVEQTYFMAWYTDSTLTYSTSNDGVHWSSSNTSLVSSTNDSVWDGHVNDPSVVLDGSVIRLWYSGISAKYSLPVSIGLAYCNLIVVSSSTTITNTASTTVTVQQTVRETTTTTETTQVSTLEPPYYLWTSVILAAVLAVTLVMAYLTRRRK